MPNVTPKRIRATFSEIWRYLISNIDPTKENFLSTIYDQCKITTNSKKDILRFIDSLLYQLQKELEIGIKNSRKSVTVRFLLDVLSNQKSKILFVDYLDADKKIPELKTFVQKLEDIISEHTNDTDFFQKNKNLSTEVKPGEIFFTNQTNIEAIDNEKNKKVDLKYESVNIKSNKLAKNKNVSPRANLFAAEIYIRDILKDESKYSKLMTSPGDMKQFIRTKVNKDYQDGKYGNSSYKEIILSANRHRMGPLKTQLRQIIDNPKEFLVAGISEKANKILKSIEDDFPN